MRTLTPHAHATSGRTIEDTAKQTYAALNVQSNAWHRSAVLCNFSYLAAIDYRSSLMYGTSNGGTTTKRILARKVDAWSRWSPHSRAAFVFITLAPSIESITTRLAALNVILNMQRHLQSFY